MPPSFHGHTHVKRQHWKQDGHPFIQLINLSMIPSSAPNVKAVAGQQALIATFEIQTYVVRTAPPKAPPAGKAPPKPAAEGEK